MQALTAALLSSQQSNLNQIKQESFSNDELLKLVSGSDFLQGNWMNSLNSVNPLANLNLMQQQQANNEGLVSAMGEPVDNKLVFDMARNQLSTESTASTSSTGGHCPTRDQLQGFSLASLPQNTTASNNEQIPRKQDIQNDIRHNKGRFELVRKRGRSEVWNLFGQVVDKQTGTRLPYVACYACKVLYTDTGGGTGNMTRHRCSVGSSYRSYGSSLDTLGEGTQSSSFDTSHAFNGPNSPELSQSQHNTSAAREAFANSSGYHATQTGSLGGSSGYGTYGSTSVESLSDTHRNFFRSSSAGNSSSISSGISILLHPNSAATAPAVQPPPQLHRNGSSGLTNSNTPVISLNLSAPTQQPGQNTSRSQAASPNPLQQVQQTSQSQLTTPQLGQTFKPTPTRPTSSLQSHPLYSHPNSPHVSPSIVINGAGYVFTQQDKQFFTEAVIKFCSKDFHNYDVVSGKGFKDLIETVLFIGKRSHGDQITNNFDPVHKLIPDAQQLRAVFAAKNNAVQQATMHDLISLKDVGLSLSCQTIHFGGNTYICVDANYLTEDWKITKRTLKVVKCESNKPSSSQYVDVVLTALDENNIADAKTILLSFDSEFDDDQQLEGLSENIVVVRNIVRALNKILIECFATCPNNENALKTVDLCKNIVRKLLEKELLLKEMPETFSDVKLTGEDIQPFPDDYIISVYSMLKFVRENLSQIQQSLEGINANELLQQIQQADWSKANEIEYFLSNFYDTVKDLVSNKEPMFQKSVALCLNLLHVLQQSNDEPEQSCSLLKTNIKIEEISRQSENSGNLSPWSQSMNRRAEELLSNWIDENVRPQRFMFMATVLDPRYKSLKLICNDIEKVNVYSQLREAANLNSKQEGEPSKKRRNFLKELEDHAMEEDELDAYLRTPPLSQLPKSLGDFWALTGEREFSKIAHFTRFILGTQCALGPLRQHMPSSKINADDIGTLLKLRSEVSTNRNCSETRHFLKHA